LLFVGRCLSCKGLDLGLQIFAKILLVKPDVTLTVVGDGEEKKRWMALAKNLGVDASIEWLGWLSKADVQRLYPKYDVFFFPSLRDSGGFVVLEALQHGLPVVCFKLGGPGVLVDDTCGKAVIADSDIQKTISDYAEAVLDTLLLGMKCPQMQNQCRQRVQFFTWDSLIKRIYGGL